MIGGEPGGYTEPTRDATTIAAQLVQYRRESGRHRFAYLRRCSSQLSRCLLEPLEGHMIDQPALAVHDGQSTINGLFGAVECLSSSFFDESVPRPLFHDPGGLDGLPLLPIGQGG